MAISLTKKVAPKAAPKNIPTAVEFNGRYISAVGRRKTAVARVRLYDDKGSHFIVNGKPHTAYLNSAIDVTVVQEALDKTNRRDLSVSVVVKGGGVHSQAQAIRHGIVRGLLKMDKDYRLIFKPIGWITRDPREKERKKPGLKRARRAPQWSKR